MSLSARLVLALLLVLAGCARTDVRQASLCQRAIIALEDGAEPIGPIEIRRGDTAVHDLDSVTLVYRIAGQSGPRSLTCRFAAASGTGGLVGVATPAGELTPTRLAMLRIWLDLAEEPPDDTHRPPPPPVSPLGYLLQQLVNGLVLGAIYCLIAIGYAQVFSLLEIVNFAFGELYMMGAYFALIAFVLLAGTGLDHGPASIAIALALAVSLSLPWGWAIERLVYRPLGRPRKSWRAGSPDRLIPLVSAVGLSIALQNLVRLGQGNRNKWLAPIAEGHLELPLGDGTALRVGVLQIAILAGAAAVCAGLWLLLQRSGFGRQQRACAQDRVAAALLGVDVDRVVSRSFMLGAALAGIAGCAALVYYGEADPSMGDSVGFKALSAAVLGGIGSLGGSMIGGLLIGLAESLWAGYFDGAYRDVVIFAVLIAMLILRPAGLFGDPGKTSS